MGEVRDTELKFEGTKKSPGRRLFWKRVSQGPGHRARALAAGHSLSRLVAGLEFLVSIILPREFHLPRTVATVFGAWYPDQCW